MNHNPGGPARGLPADEPAMLAPLLVGRVALLQSLLSVVVGLDEPAAAGALLVGECGTGKSSLLRSVGTSVQGLVSSGARPGDASVPYASLSRWLRTLLPRAAGGLDGPTREALASLLPELAAPGPAAGTGPPPPALVARWLQRAAADVVAWAVDDLHLADEASARWWLRLLRGLPREAAPFLLASEPPRPGSAVESLLEGAAALAGVRTLNVAPLDRSQVFDWVLEEGAPAISAARADGVAGRLMQVSGGLPLHLELLLHDPQRGAGSLPEALSVADAPSPLALLPLIGERLARLGPSALAVARAAAIAGQDHSDEATMDVTGLHPDELADALHELRRHGLWAGGTFAHERIREAALQAMPRAHAQLLHAHLAGWLEARGEAAAERVAAHWLSAGQPARAVPALRLAGRRARQLGERAHAIACLVRAATLAEEHGELDLAFDCACEAFETHADALRDTQGPSLLAQLRRLARSPRQQARSTLHAAWHTMVGGELEAALPLAEEALRRAGAERDAWLLAQAQQVLGTTLGLAGQLKRGLALLEAAEPVFREHAPADERASLAGNLAAVLDNLGRADDARRRHLAALAQVPRDADAQRATLLANYAAGRLEAGDPIGARELAGKALDLVAAGSDGPAGLVALVTGGSERALGRYASALDWCERAEPWLARHAAQRMPLAQLLRAQVWLDLGAHERALQLLDGAGLPLGRQLPARHTVRWLLLLARTRQRAGGDAVAVLDEAEQQLPAEGWPELGWLLQVERALARPDDQAARRLREIAEGAEAAGLANVALGAWLHAALLAANQPDEVTGARAAADRALAIMMQGVEPIHVERALRWLAPARALAASGEPVRARGLLLRGQHWLATTAAQHVPPAWRTTFLEAQPLNRLLRDSPAGGA